MAIRLPVYEQHVQLDSGAHTIARIHADDATGKAISRIGESMISVAAHWKGKEEQRDRYRYMDQLGALNAELARIRFEVGQEYQPGIHPPDWMHQQITERSKPLIAAWVNNAPESQRDRAVSHGKALAVETDLGSATLNSQVDKKYYGDQLNKIAGGFSNSLKSNPDGFANAVAQYDETLKATASLSGYEKETVRRGHLKQMLDSAIEGYVKNGRVDEARKLNDDFTAKMDAEDKTQRGAPAVGGGGAGPRSEGGFNANRVAQIDRNPQIKDAIEKAAQATGMDPNVLKTVASIESGGKPGPGSTTGSYKGLFQLSNAEFQRGGGGNIYDPYDNALAAAKVLSQHAAKFEQTNGRPPTASDLYLIHQQGEAGAAAHTKNPDQPAWRSMFSTAEGQQKGEAWAKKAIWGNIPDSEKAKFGSVENVTSRDFAALWKSKVEGRGGTTVAAAPKTGGFTEEETGTRKIQTAAAEPATATDATAEAKPRVIVDPETGQMRQETTEEISARGNATASNAPPPRTPAEPSVIPAPAPKSFWQSQRDNNSIVIDGRQLKISATDKMMKSALTDLLKNDVRNIERFGVSAQMPPEMQKYFGAPSGELTHEMIANKLGEAVAIQWEEDKLTAGRFHGVIDGMELMSRDAIVDRLASAKPVPGSFDLIRQEKSYDRALKYAQGVMEERNKDPAAAAEAFPRVQELKDGLRKAQEDQLQNPSLAGERKVTEMQTQLADARMRAQELLGIPMHERSPVTVADAERIASVLLDRSNPNANKAADAVVKEIKAISGGNPDIERRAFDTILSVSGIRKEDQEAVANRLARANRPAAAGVEGVDVDEAQRRAIKPRGPFIQEFANAMTGGGMGLADIPQEHLPEPKEGAFIPGTKQLDSGHINELLNDPSVSGIFDRMYGRGASDYVLGDARTRGFPVGPRSDYADNPEVIPEVGPELPAIDKQTDVYDPDKINPLDVADTTIPEL